MTSLRVLAGAAALACSLFSTVAVHAAASDYRFELVGKSHRSGQKNVVQVRLVHTPDGKPVPDAVIFESKADMGPAGMESMTAPVKATPGAKGASTASKWIRAWPAPGRCIWQPRYRGSRRPSEGQSTPTW
jgi:YtkA-like